MARFWTKLHLDGEVEKTITPWEINIDGGDKEQRPSKPHYNVTAAVIVRDGLVLAVKKGETKYAYTSNRWEFPGGKIENGETAREAIVREIAEELSMDISVTDHLVVVEHTYDDFSITLNVFLCAAESGEPRLSEHVAAEWLTPRDLIALDFCAADKPVAAAVYSRLRFEAED